MTRAYFGTDGIRGTANSFPMTPEVAMRVGLAAGKRFRSADDRRHLVVIGKDTRLSGYMLEPALTAGFTAAGMDVVLFGPLPTPAVAMLTRSLRADLGVMLSASHNKFADNGIKLFGPDGYKLSDEAELEIEQLMDSKLDEHLAAPDKLGRARRIDDAQARYVEIVKATFPKRLTLKGMRIVIDAANGAGYKVAPVALYELGAEVIKLGVEPDGFNINQEVGSTDVRALKKAVLEYRADIGIALDGDADRVAIVDEKGNLIDGDQLMALIAKNWKEQGLLAKPGIVATVMSNLGLERFLQGMKLGLERTKVGDRYVVEHMRAALQVIAVIQQTGKPASEVCKLFDPAPQVLENVRYEKGKPDPMEAASVKEAIKAAEAALSGKGRLLVRKSGTEPLVRIMAEGDDESLVQRAVKDVKAAVVAAARAA
jgi:phosphoglucosamine mutase